MTPETTAAVLTQVLDDTRQEYTWNHDRYLRGDSPQTTWRQLSDGLAIEVEALEQAIQDVAMNEKFARAIVDAQWSGVKFCRFCDEQATSEPSCPWCEREETDGHAPDCIVREALAVLARIEAEGKP